MRSMNLKKLFSGAVIAMAIAGMGAVAKADDAVITFSGNNVIGAGGFVDTIGWKFHVGQDITVTSVGYWDNGLDGLLSSHDVAIWTDGGVLLGGGTVNAGLANTLSGDFRYNTVGTQFNLLAGQDYVIGGLNNFEDYAYGATSLTTAPQITWMSSQYDAIGGSPFPVFPTTHAAIGDMGYFGPSFQFQAAVPEPGTYAMGAGMLISGLCFFRKRRRA